MGIDMDEKNPAVAKMAVIIVVSPMAAFYIENLVSQYCGRFDNVYVVEVYWKEIVRDSNSFKLFRFVHGNGISKLASVRSAVKCIDTLVASHGGGAFFIAHPMHLVTNYVARFCKKNNMELNLVPDGIINYYPCSVNQFRSAIFIKRFLSPLLLLGFFDLHNDCLGFDAFSYKAIFSLTKKNLIVGDCKVVNVIDFIESEDGVSRNAGLIIGQPLNLPFFKLRDAIFKMVCCLRSRGVSDISYKPHPSERVDDLLFGYLKELEVRLCEGGQTAEFLVGEYMYFCSLASSALANIKIISPSSVCIAFISYFEGDASGRQLQAIRSYFEGVGVEIND